MLFRSKKRRDRPRTAPAQLLPVTGARDLARVHAICETRNDQGRPIMIVLATAIGAPASAAAMTSRLAPPHRAMAIRKKPPVALSRWVASTTARTSPADPAAPRRRLTRPARPPPPPGLRSASPPPN